MKTVHAATFLASSALSGAALAQTAVEPVTPAPGPLERFSWSGFYGGVHAGGVWTHRENGFDNGDCGPFTNLTGVDGVSLGDAEDAFCADRTVQDGPNLGGVYPSFDLDDDYVAYTGDGGYEDDANWLAGGHVGFNSQVGRYVFGLEADLSGTQISSSSSHDFDYFREASACESEDDFCLVDYVGSGSISVKSEIDWLATFRARFGVAFGPQDRFLAYATGGVAMAGITDKISGTFDDLESCAGCFYRGADDTTDYRLGYAVGLGGEFAITRNVSLGAEYLYVNLNDGGRTDITFVGEGGRSFDVESDGRLDSLQTVRARLSWRFGAP